MNEEKEWQVQCLSRHTRTWHTSENAPGRWTLDEGLRQARFWKDKFPEFSYRLRNPETKQIIFP